MCGSKRVSRRLVTVQFRNGRTSSPVPADVCSNCGERYYDMSTAQKLDRERRGQNRKRRTR
ncbi:MAG: YgiT-type zinc finger protein [Planctomycetes bacterium]|nr:YgiT-type zinc finger protein [Planctomycetota bacterium]